LIVENGRRVVPVHEIVLEDARKGQSGHDEQAAEGPCVSPRHAQPGCALPRSHRARSSRRAWGSHKKVTTIVNFSVSCILVPGNSRAYSPQHAESAYETLRF